ncbi:hypothetical protein A0H76_892 [Hepatospora eriocheir]|uniref:Uncharacterized protein n=1 Tax=Hepatospora eriocheir TaxID=1081669 RepID=A0A1X0QI02_9MICR|nr:hypothetical protein A0H76_892 [Hepatospora eriocheir]
MDQNVRLDGRQSNELRNTTIKKINEQVIFSQGLTSVRVFTEKSDKFEVKILDCDDIDRKVFEMKLKLERLFTPLINQTEVAVNLYVIQDNGSLFSTLVNAITICFCYSGIHLNDFVVGITLNQNLDLCLIEEKKEDYLNLVYSVKNDKILYLESVGKIYSEFLVERIETGIKATKVLHNDLVNKILIN